MVLEGLVVEKLVHFLCLWVELRSDSGVDHAKLVVLGACKGLGDSRSGEVSPQVYWRRAAMITIDTSGEDNAVGVGVGVCFNFCFNLCISTNVGIQENL